MIAVLLAVAFAYQRGKKCGAWQAVHGGPRSKQELLTKPAFCWRLH